MRKPGKLISAIVLASLIFTGCKTNSQPVSHENPPQASTEVPMPVESDESISAENAEDGPATSAEAQPLYANQIQEGSYQIDVSSSSSMFRIIDARLTVANGKMSAVLTLSGTGYEKLYMGTGEEALADTDDKCIYFVENSDGKYTYEVPVTALNQDVSCAAWSIKKQKWYDRTLVFQSAQIPSDAIMPIQGQMAQPIDDGQYEISVTLSGGSGRTEVQSPAGLTVTDGKIIATVIWSSPYYEYMLVNGTTYKPINTDGNSTFQIPVLLDQDMDVSAQTIAMGTPHEIDYTLHFDSATMKPLERK